MSKVARSVCSAPATSSILVTSTKFGGACTVGARILRKDFVVSATLIVSTKMEDGGRSAQPALNPGADPRVVGAIPASSSTWRAAGAVPNWLRIPGRPSGRRCKSGTLLQFWNHDRMARNKFGTLVPPAREAGSIPDDSASFVVTVVQRIERLAVNQETAAQLRSAIPQK